MGRFTRTLGPAATITGAIGLWIAVMVSVSATGAPRQNGAMASKGPSTAITTPAATPLAGYVGEETCLGCHEDKQYHGTKHAQAKNPRTPAAGQGCESCHGPGQAHVDGGGDKTKIKNPKTLTMTAIHKPIAPVMVAAGPRVRVKRPICPPSRVLTDYECVITAGLQWQSPCPFQIRPYQPVARRSCRGTAGFPSLALRRIQQARVEFPASRHANTRA